jgi:hypothetical protein
MFVMKIKKNALNMLTTKKIVTKVYNMKFFDSSLNIIQEKVDKLKPQFSRQVDRFENELKICFRLKTIHTYLQLPDKYGTEDNINNIIIKSEFKRKTTDKDLADDVGTVIINTISYKGVAFFIEPTQWDNYLNAYNQLLKK